MDEAERGWRDRVFTFLTEPNSSKGARRFNWYMDALVIVSILVFCCESVPEWSRTVGQRAAWFALESVFGVHFFVDLVLKLVTQPTMGYYAMSWDVLIDVLSIVPWGYALYWLLVLSTAKHYTTLRLLRMLRFIRFFSITLSNVPRMNVFIKAVRRSGLAVLFLGIYVFGAGLFFSGCLFFAETADCVLDRESSRWMQPGGTTPCPVQNMFDAIWLCVVTMATVGYGDLVPHTGAGKVIAGLVMLTSMVFLPLPASIFGANLTELYLEARLVHRLEKVRARHSDKAPGLGGGGGDDGQSQIERSESVMGGAWPNASTVLMTEAVAGGSTGAADSPPPPSSTLSMHETMNLFSFLEALESTTEHISHSVAKTNGALSEVRRQQRALERWLVKCGGDPEMGGWH